MGCLEGPQEMRPSKSVGHVKIHNSREQTVCIPFVQVALYISPSSQFTAFSDFWQDEVYLGFQPLIDSIAFTGPALFY